LSDASQRLPAGRFAGVFAMGGVSALIVSPCVAAPLAGALVYLSQTRDVWLGGTALFALAAGMSVPLLLVGASAGALLPAVRGRHVGRDIALAVRSNGFIITDIERFAMPTSIWPLRAFAQGRALVDPGLLR
jgi:cytochrome c biogenesis protein CcdA